MSSAWARPSRCRMPERVGLHQVVGSLRQSHPLEDLVDGPRSDAVHPAEQPQVATAAHRREQRRGLDDRPDVSDDPPDVARGWGRSSRRHGPGRGPGQAEQAADRRRLPRPVRPEEPEHPARGDLEVEPVDGRVAAAPQRAVLLAQPFDLDHRCHGPSVAVAPSGDRYGSGRTASFRCDRLPGGVQRQREVARWAVVRMARARGLGARRASHRAGRRRGHLRHPQGHRAARLPRGHRPRPAARDPGRPALARCRRDPGPIGAAPHPLGDPEGAGRPRPDASRETRSSSSMATTSRSTCGPSSPAPARRTWRRWREAAALWRGDLLAGFSLRDSPDFDDWQAREAERLRRVMSAACARLVDACAAAGELDGGHRPRRAMAGPRPAARARPPRADAAARAARATARPPCTSTASACASVDEELGVAPLAETTALYEAITRG